MCMYIIIHVASDCCEKGLACICLIMFLEITSLLHNKDCEVKAIALPFDKVICLCTVITT